MREIELNETGVRNLLSATIRLAISDYKGLSKKKTQYCNYSEKTIENFFTTKWLLRIFRC